MWIHPIYTLILVESTPKSGCRAEVKKIQSGYDGIIFTIRKWKKSRDNVLNVRRLVAYIKRHI